MEEVAARGFGDLLLEEGEKEKIAREAALIGVVNAAGQAGIPAAQVKILRKPVLGKRAEAFGQVPVRSPPQT